MLKKMFFAAAAVCVISLFTACSSCEIATSTHNQKLTTDPKLESVAHVNADIWGIYFLGLPIFCGSSVQEGKSTIFKDTVTTDHAVALLTLTSQARLNGTYVDNLTTTRRSRWLFLTLFFSYCEVQASGTVLK